MQVADQQLVIGGQFNTTLDTNI